MSDPSEIRPLVTADSDSRLNDEVTGEGSVRPKGNPRRASILARLSDVLCVVALALLAEVRAELGSTTRVPIPRMNSITSVSRLSGRGGRAGGGPAGLVKGTVAGNAGTIMFADDWATRTGREMTRQRSDDEPEDLEYVEERLVRVFLRVGRSGASVGEGADASSGMVRALCVDAVRKKREPVIVSRYC